MSVVVCCSFPSSISSPIFLLFRLANPYQKLAPIIPIANTGPVNYGSISAPVIISQDASAATVIAAPLRAYDIPRSIFIK
jgi:hypothetical protein